MLAALPDFATSDLFTPAEKAALRFADVLARDHRSVSDELFTELKRHYTEPQIMDSSAFERTFGVGPGVDRDKVRAKMEDGILTVTLPKTQERIGRKIEIA